MGYYLAGQGRHFVILERSDSVASAWRERWESLTLFTPRRYSALPGLPFPGDPDGYPTRDEVIDYLERYAETFELPIEFNSNVRRLSREDECFVLEVDGRTIMADQVVVATGPFQTPYVPKLAEDLDSDVWQAHSTGYRRPSDVPEGTVLVVGGGNTGFQIAEGALLHPQGHPLGRHSPEAAAAARGRPRPLLVADEDGPDPQDRRVAARATAERPRHADRLEPARAHPPLRGRAEATRVAASGRTVRFEDGSEVEVDAVIWATGYRPDYSWIDLPIFGSDGRLRHRRGVTDVPVSTFSASPGSTRAARR